jgi:hypothetical protein
MSKLNCSIGDLAITVQCNIPENLGNIVRIITAEGFKEWEGHDQPIYTWNVEVATEGGALYYQGEDGLEAYLSGPVPDRCLKRLTPPKGYLIDEFEDSTQLQMDLHVIDEGVLEDAES